MHNQIEHCILKKLFHPFKLLVYKRIFTTPNCYIFNTLMSITQIGPLPTIKLEHSIETQQISLMFEMKWYSKPVSIFDFLHNAIDLMHSLFFCKKKKKKNV